MDTTLLHVLQYRLYPFVHICVQQYRGIVPKARSRVCVNKCPFISHTWHFLGGIVCISQLLGCICEIGTLFMRNWVYAVSSSCLQSKSGDPSACKNDKHRIGTNSLIYRYHTGHAQVILVRCDGHVSSYRRCQLQQLLLCGPRALHY
jgi:hypothetical protein